MKRFTCTPGLLILTLLVGVIPAQVHALEVWSIGVYKGNSPLSLQPTTGVVQPVLTANDVTDISAGFVADPFILPANGIWYMFFEVYNNVSQQGDIAYATSIDGLNWTYQQVVLDESFHLSYPYVFEWQGKHYMVPETSEANAITLYQATGFPTIWEPLTDLVTGVYIDPSPFFYNGSWWMYAGGLGNDSLHLFYADSLTGPWNEHLNSPLIVSDANIARPGGRVLQFDGKLYRIAQDDFPSYGNQVRAFEVTDITRTTYVEVEVPESPLFGATGGTAGWNAAGMHHLDARQLDDGTWLAVVDGLGDGAPFYQSAGIPKTDWTLWSVDSEELIGENGAAVNAFDGDTNTFWHTQWLTTGPTPPPHDIQISLGGSYNIDGFRYIPRQDGGINGRILNYEFYVSRDGVNWRTPVAYGTFVNDTSIQEIRFPSVIGGYIRLRALSEVNGNPWTSVAELDVYDGLSGYSNAVISGGNRDWRLWSVDSEELIGENGAAVNAFDGDTSTFWHTQWLTTGPTPPPHDIQIRLDRPYNIYGISYTPRQDGGVNGRILNYELYVSRDGVNWGTPVASGAFVGDTSTQVISFPGVRYQQYIRLRALSEVNGNPWTSVAELKVHTWLPRP